MEEFLKAVGVGVRGSKDLSFEQAREAMKLILDGEEELTGFLQALRDETKIVDVSYFNPIDLSVPYDGKNRTPHILPAAIFIATVLTMMYLLKWVAVILKTGKMLLMPLKNQVLHTFPSGVSTENSLLFFQREEDFI